MEIKMETNRHSKTINKWSSKFDKNTRNRLLATLIKATGKVKWNLPKKTKICNLRRKKNSGKNFLRLPCTLSFCQKSEKTNEPIPRIAGNRRTDERTNGRRYVNLKDLRGRSKKLKHDFRDKNEEQVDI